MEKIPSITNSPYKKEPRMPVEVDVNHRMIGNHHIAGIQKSITMLPSKNFPIDRRGFKEDKAESEDDNCEVFVEPGYFPCKCNVCTTESKPGPKNHTLKQMPFKL